MEHEKREFSHFSPLGHKTNNKSGEACSSKATFPQFERLFLERLYVLVACQDRITLNFLDRSFSRRGYNFRIPRDQTMYSLTFLLFVKKSEQNGHKNLIVSRLVTKICKNKLIRDVNFHRPYTRKM